MNATAIRNTANTTSQLAATQPGGRGGAQVAASDRLVVAHRTDGRDRRWNSRDHAAVVSKPGASTAPTPSG